MSTFPPSMPLQPGSSGQPYAVNPLELMMNPGMPPGAFQHQQGGIYDPSQGLPEDSELALELQNLRHPGQITEEEIEAAYVRLQEDPQAAARRDLIRIYLSEQSFVADIARLIGSQKLTPKSLQDYRKIQSEAIKNIQFLTDALGLQPKQAKDDGTGDDIASLSERYERWLKERETPRPTIERPHSVGRPDPRGPYKTNEELGYAVKDLVRERYNLQELIEDQYVRIDEQTNTDV